MLKWILTGAGALVVLLLIGGWYLLLGAARAPTSAPGVFDIEDWRSRTDLARNDLPSELRLIEIAHGAFPSFAVQAGRFDGSAAMSFNALQLVYPDGNHIIIGGGVDRETAAQLGDDAAETFDETIYLDLQDAMLDAEQVLITHEHLDHVMAIARHRDPGAVAGKLVLNAPQAEALPAFADAASVEMLQSLTPKLSGDVERLAPGLVVAPAAGHTAGSQVFFVTLQDGSEYLLIGDIVWAMSNIEDLTTRPVLTQYVVFEPNETRSAVKAQLRAIHDLMTEDPDLIVVPSHDRAYLMDLVERGDLALGLKP